MSVVLEHLVFWLRNLFNLTFLTSFAYWWLSRQLSRDKSLYKSYHATMAMALSDLQGSGDLLDMQAPVTRDFAATRTMEVLFTLPRRLSS